MINEVLSGRELERSVGISNVGSQDSYWIEQRIDRLQNDVEGLTNHLGLERVYGSSFQKSINRRIKKVR